MKSRSSKSAPRVGRPGSALAVEEKLALHLPFFFDLGLTRERLEDLKTAVANHCLLEDPPPEHPHYRVTALLKDADALDRWRIGERPSPRFLRLPGTERLVEPARALYERTCELESFDEVWRAALEVFGERLPGKVGAGR